MIQASPSAKKVTRKKPRTPSKREIEAACQEVQSGWSKTEKRKRRVARRVDEADPQFLAHLKFIQMLIAGQTR